MATTMKRGHMKSRKAAWLAMSIIAGFSFSDELGFSAYGQINADSTTEVAIKNELDRVYQSIPADAFFVAYVNDIDQSLGHPLFALLVEEAPEAKGLVQSFVDTLDGPFALAISGTPMLPFMLKFTFVGESNLDDAAFQEHLGELTTAWNTSPLSVMGGLSFIEGEIPRIGFTGPVSYSLDVQQRDGLVVASNLAGFDDWLQTAPPEGLFANKPDWAKLTSGLSGTPNCFAYLDLRAIIPLAMVPLSDIHPKLFDALQLSNLQAVSVMYGYMASTNSGAKNADTGATPTRKERENAAKNAPRREPSLNSVLRLAASVKNDVPGVWHFTASDPIVPKLSAAFPSDTTFFIHGSMANAAGLMDDFLAFQNAIDPELADEYKQERADFKREVGFDPHADFLANLVSEWAFGGNFTEQGIEPLIAIRIGDEDRFLAHVHALRNHFDLQTTISSYRGVNVETAERTAGSFSFAVTQKTLLVSTAPQAVAEAIDAMIDKKCLALSRGFSAMRKRVPGPASRFAYLNLPQAVSALRELVQTDSERDMLTRIAAAGEIAIAMVPHDGALTVDFHFAKDISAVMVRTIRDSLRETNKQAARLISMSNMRGIVTSCLIYAHENKNKWPESLDVLIQDGSIAPASLHDPYDAESTKPGQSFYLYRHVTDPRSVKSPDKEVVLCESIIRDGGANFAFMDGHVEWITGAEAERLLAMMKRGR